MLKKTFVINSELYQLPMIEEAIHAFADFQISFSENTLTIEDENPQYIFDEFMNYVLSISLE